MSVLFPSLQKKQPCQIAEPLVFYRIPAELIRVIRVCPRER
ncbi:hypothetical protein HMPREF9413_5284 [Paenibacillus sp. HGF7]|nr:hypothetical protein HMPREF9413_5284 [Paenibacillus sp. HGF7]